MALDEIQDLLVHPVRRLQGEQMAGSVEEFHGDPPLAPVGDQQEHCGLTPVDLPPAAHLHPSWPEFDAPADEVAPLDELDRQADMPGEGRARRLEKTVSSSPSSTLGDR
jgi:hypothetical protein